MKRFQIRISAVAGFVLLATTHLAWSAPSNGTLLMGVMGDSISAGTLADLPIPHASDSSEPGDSPASLNELNSRILFENKSTYSWASGLLIDSHYLKLRRYLKDSGDLRPLNVSNVAYPGDRSIAIPNQARKLVRNFQVGGYEALEYVTLLIGANDACAADTQWGIPAQQIRDHLMEAFRILSTIRQNEPIRVLVVGIPRIPELAEPQIRDSKTLFGKTCEFVRNHLLKECNPLLSWRTEDEYNQKMEIIEIDNLMLRSVVDEVNRAFPNIQAVYSDRLYNLKIPRSIMAADCFHPAATGQQRLADEVWLDQPWFG